MPAGIPLQTIYNCGLPPLVRNRYGAIGEHTIADATLGRLVRVSDKIDSVNNFGRDY